MLTAVGLLKVSRLFFKVSALFYCNSFNYTAWLSYAYAAMQTDKGQTDKGQTRTGRANTVQKNKTQREPNIRPAKSTDRNAILAMLPQLADFNLPQGRDPKHLWAADADLADAVLNNRAPDTFCHVAVNSNDQPIGLILVSLRPEMLSCTPSAHLEAIVVHPDARGKGLGRLLLTYAEAAAKQHGAQSLTLHVFANNTRARALYDSHGFNSELIRAIKWLT